MNSINTLPLRSANKAVRTRAQKALTSIGHQAIPTLLELMDPREYAWTEEVLETLVCINKKWTNTSECINFVASKVNLLGLRFRDTDIVKDLDVLDAIDSSWPRSQAATNLVPVLITNLDNITDWRALRDNPLDDNAILLLGYIAPHTYTGTKKEVAETLCSVLEKTYPEDRRWGTDQIRTRTAAIKALGKLGDDGRGCAGGIRVRMKVSNSRISPKDIEALLEAAEYALTQIKGDKPVLP